MGQTILYIEDNPNNMQLVGKIVRSRGYELIEAVNGESGLETAENQRPNLILLDINLPDVDGYEVARRLRETEFGASVPIIAVTANALVGDNEKALAAGCDDYLAKPINIRQLLGCIGHHLAQKA